MINREEINGMIFIEQTTFYIYPNDEAVHDDRPFLTTSDKRVYDKYKYKEEFIVFKNNKTNILL